MPRAPRLNRLLSSLTALIALTACAAPAHSDGELTAAELQALIQQLDHDDFAVRAEAEQALVKASAGNIATLEAVAARSDAEHGARIVAVLERLYVGSSAGGSGRQWARAACVSSADVVLTLMRVGDFDDSESAQMAEAALERLAAMNSPVGSYADSALSRHGLLRENRAIQQLRALGAKIVFSTEPDFRRGLGFLQDFGTNPAGEPAAVPLNQVVNAYILTPWSGGKEGLALLNRLRVEELQVYLIEGNGITERDLYTHAGGIRMLDVEYRSNATLGVASSVLTRDRCEVGGLPEGLAAHRAGVLLGDEIIALDGLRISNFESLVDLLKSYRSRDVIELLVLRGASRPVDRLFPGGPGDEPEQLPQPPGQRGMLMEIEVTLSDWSEVPDFTRPPRS